MSKSLNPHPDKAPRRHRPNRHAPRTRRTDRTPSRRGRRQDGGHIEASLRIFKPDLDLDGIAPRLVPPAHHGFRGAVSRILLEALRKADRPLSTTKLTDRVMKERGLNMKDAKLRQTMGKRVGAALSHWRRVRGALESMKGPGLVLYWQIKRTANGFET